MSDYAAIVERADFSFPSLVITGLKPYWATPSRDGAHCFVSWSGSDSVSAISYATGREVSSVQVGDHPQRMRLGKVDSAWLSR